VEQVTSYVKLTVSTRFSNMSDTERDTISPIPVSPTKLKGDIDSSEDESSEIVNNGGTDSSSTDNGEHHGSNGVTNGVNGSSTDSEEEVEENELEKHEVVTNGNRFTEDGEPEFKPKKAADSDSSETEDEPDSEGESEGEIVDKTDNNIDTQDGCIASKVEQDEDKFIEESPVQITETAPSPEPVESVSPEPIKDMSPEPTEADYHERSPSPEEPSHKSPSPIRSRSPTPERKDSRGSNGSSSYDDERASSLSPEPPKVIAAPSSKLTSPVSPPSSQNKNAITKIYTEALVNDSDGEEGPTKAPRQKPTSDITSIYTQKIAEAESPKPERAKFSKPNKDITQLYTAAFNKDDSSPSKGDQIKPRRNENITKLYTGGLGSTPDKSFKGKPNDEVTNPRKHNMATAVDKEAIKEAYNEVMADKNGVEWAAFTFTDNKLGVTATGDDFETFKTHFGPDDRGFGYIKIMTGDEMSKRSKFVFCTWVGPNVSVMKKAKMSTDKALMKEIIQNLSVELQIENANEFNMEHFKAEVDKAGGARYGTGVRDL